MFFRSNKNSPRTGREVRDFFSSLWTSQTHCWDQTTFTFRGNTRRKERSSFYLPLELPLRVVLGNVMKRTSLWNFSFRGRLHKTRRNSSWKRGTYTTSWCKKVTFSLILQLIISQYHHCWTHFDTWAISKLSWLHNQVHRGNPVSPVDCEHFIYIASNAWLILC